MWMQRDEPAWEDALVRLGEWRAERMWGNMDHPVRSREIEIERSKKTLPLPALLALSTKRYRSGGFDTLPMILVRDCEKFLTVIEMQDDLGSGRR